MMLINTLEDFRRYFDYSEVTEKEFVPGLRPKGYYIQSYKKDAEEVTISDFIEGKQIIRINGFGIHPELKKITIPESVDFDSAAFDDCPGLIRDGLDFSEEFFEMCELICSKQYDDLEEVGTVYEGKIGE